MTGAQQSALVQQCETFKKYLSHITSCNIKFHPGHPPAQPIYKELDKRTFNSDNWVYCLKHCLPWWLLVGSLLLAYILANTG